MAGGPIESINVWGRNFSIASDADAGRDLGGFTSEIEMNGDGTGRDVMSRKPWKIDGLTASINDLNGDQEFLQNIADKPGRGPISITYVDGSVYQGSGRVTGELKFQNGNSTASLELSGAGKLTKQ